MPESKKRSAQSGTTAPGNTAHLAAVRVDNTTRRSDDDALEGHFVKVIGGEHEGQLGAYLHTLEADSKTGYPAQILVRFRDATYGHDVAAVAYKDVRPATPYVGGR